MLKRIAVFLVLVFGASSLWSQETLIFEKTDLEFQRALLSFEKGLYNKSIRGFERYIDLAGKDGGYTEEALYYIVCSKLRLNHANALDKALYYLESHPVSQRSIFVKKEIGDYYYYRNEFKKASRYYAQVSINILDRDETDEFLFRKGYTLFAAGKYEDAKQALYPLTLRPTKNYVKAVYYYGYVCYKNGEYAEALSAFLKIEDKGPQSMQLYICQMYYLKGDYNKAITYADQVNLGKLETEKNIVKGKSYYRLHDYENAAKSFNRGYSSYDNLSEDDLYEVGYAYFKSGQCNQAFIAFSKIATKGTSLAQIASYHLGECFVKADKKQNAYNAFFEAQRTDFDKEIKENAMFNLGKLAFELEEHKTAIETFNRFIELFPSSKNKPEAQKLLARLFLVSTDYKSAIPILENIPNLDAESRGILHQILVLRGEELILSKDYAEAKKLFVKAGAMRETPVYQALANFWLGEIEFLAKNKTEALKHYQLFQNHPAAKETPYHNYAFYAAAYVHFDQKKYPDALTSFQRFRALNKQTPGEISYYNDAILRIADCFYSSRNYNEALDNYAFISAKKAAGSDYALFQQGMIYGLQNKSQLKISTMRKITTDFSNSTFVEHAIYEIATEWLQLENYKEAERNFRYLIEDFPNTKYGKNSYLALGIMFYNQEKDDLAIKEFEILVKNYPGTQEAKSGIGYIEKIYISRGESAKYLAWLETIPNTGISVSFRDSVSYQAAFNLYLNNNCAGAIDNFKKYLSEFPKGFFSVSARFYLATCLDKTGKSEEALKYYEMIVNGNPTEFREESAKRLAVYYFQRKQYAEALPFYDKLELFSSDRQTLQNALLGQVRCAFELSDLALTENKGNRLLRMDNLPVSVQGEVRNKIAILYYESKELDIALNFFKQTLGISKDENAAEAYYFQCQILYDKLNLAESKKLIFEYSKQFARYEYWQARVFILLAEVYNKESDVFQAKATVNFVLENYDDPDILERARKLKEIINR